MKTNRLIANCLIFLFFAFPSFCHAGIGIFSLRSNNEIDSVTRKEIHEFNTQVVHSFKNNNYQYMYDLFSEEAKKTGLASIKEFYENCGEIIRTNDFKQSDDYFVKYLGLGKSNTTFPSDTKPKFFMQLAMSNQGPKLISLMESQGNFKDYILSFIYHKIKNAWRLQTCHLGIIRIANKGVMDWYLEAESMYKKTHYLSALLRLSVAGQFLQPAPFIQYEDEKKVHELDNNCRLQLKNITFPYEVQLPTKPQILSIVPQFLKGDLLPLVNYLSSISFENENQLKIEAESMLPEIERLFPDISSYTNYVAFKAFNEMPSDPQKQYVTFGVVVEVKK